MTSLTFKVFIIKNLKQRVEETQVRSFKIHFWFQKRKQTNKQSIMETQKKAERLDFDELFFFLGQNLKFAWLFKDDDDDYNKYWESEEAT